MILEAHKQTLYILLVEFNLNLETLSLDCIDQMDERYLLLHNIHLYSIGNNVKHICVNLSYVLLLRFALRQSCLKKTFDFKR